MEQAGEPSGGAGVEDGTHVRLVAISSSYGAGGGRIGRQLADRLQVPFIDRAIPAAVAHALAVGIDEAELHDEQVPARWLERLLSGFLAADTGAPTSVPARTPTAEDFRRATEEVLLRQAKTGEGVIVGRAGVVLLRNERGVLRVRLDGPQNARIRQAMDLQGIDEQTATHRLRELDRAHLAYAKHFYGVDIRDPRLYHVIVDSTSIPLATCTEMLYAAASALRAPKSSGP